MLCTLTRWWGIGLVLDGAVTTFVVYRTPIDVAVVMSAGIGAAVVLTLIGWSIWYLRRYR